LLIGLVTCFATHDGIPAVARAAGERLDVQRLRVLPVDPVADAAQPREVAQVLHRGGSAGHLRDRATSRRRCLAPPVITTVPARPSAG
jgi:hypothetical protein